MRAEITPQDLLGRFTPTPLAADLRVMDRVICLQTNSPAIQRQMERAFACYEPQQGGVTRRGEFLWRLVGEDDTAFEPPWPEVSGFSDEGLRCINIGQLSFVAVDLDTRSAIGFLAEELASDESGFNKPFLAVIFSMTAEALGLTPLSAAGVALDDRGLLIFGLPNSGKSTSCYLAGKLGLEFHADQVTFLELEGTDLRAWGDFWPAAFHEQTLQFLPELSRIAQPVNYGGQTYLYLRKNPLPAPVRRSVVPVSCVFLEREKARPSRLKPLEHEDFEARLKEAFFFREGARFEPNRSAVCRALGQLPAYALAYGSDPSEAAGFFGKLLSAGTPFGNRA